MDRSEGAQAARVLRPETLKVIIQARQVGEEQVRRVRFGEQAGDGVGDPLRGLDRGQRAPVLAEPEGAAGMRGETGLHAIRPAVAPHDHAAAVRVDRGGRKQKVHRLAQTLLEKGQAHCAAPVAERLPDARPLHQGAGLLPKGSAAQQRIKKPVRDHTVRPRRQAGAQGSLGGAGQGRKDRSERAQRQAGHRSHTVPRGPGVAERGDLNDQQFLHARSSAMKFLPL